MDNSINIFIMGIFIAVLAFFIKKWIDSLDKVISELNKENNKDHEEIWKRVNKHGHNGEGHVVILEE